MSPTLARVLELIGEEQMSARTLSYRANVEYAYIGKLVRAGKLQVVGRLKPEHRLQQVGVPIVRRVVS